MLRLIRQENSFEFNGRDYLQVDDVAMGSKTAVAFADIFKGAVENENERRPKALEN